MYFFYSLDIIERPIRTCCISQDSQLQLREINKAEFHSMLLGTFNAKSSGQGMNKKDRVKNEALSSAGIVFYHMYSVITINWHVDFPLLTLNALKIFNAVTYVIFDSILGSSQSMLSIWHRQILWCQLQVCTCITVKHCQCIEFVLNSTITVVTLCFFQKCTAPLYSDHAPLTINFESEWK